MPGAWIVAVAARILHDDTFEFVVAPAVADLQFEVLTTGRRGAMRAYAAVWVAFAGGFLTDLGGDIRALYEDAADLSWLIVMQACYYTSLLVLVSGGGFGRISREAVLACVILVLSLSALPTLLCFWPARRTARARPHR